MISSRLGAVLAVAAVLAASCSSAPPAKQQIDDTKNKAAQYAETGNTYYRQGQYSQALQMFQQSLDLNLSVDNRAGAVLSYNSIGKALVAVGKTGDAETAFGSAIRTAKELDDLELLAASRINLAELYLKEGRTDEAVPILEELASAVTPKSDQADAAIVFHDLGTAYARKARYDDAIAYLNRALATNVELKRIPEQASNHYMLASVYSRQGEFDRAAAEIDAALELDKKWENSPAIAEDLYAAGRIAERSGGTERAYGYYKRALSVFLAINSIEGAKRTLEALKTTASTLNRADEAARYDEMLKKISTVDGSGQQ
ncbi:tetratricopeptide repeat protein [Salinispira pacifica]